jgi:hypothetical protein
MYAQSRLAILVLLVSIDAFGPRALARPNPPDNPPAVIAYGKLPLSVKLDDPFILFAAIEKLVEKDPFEKWRTIRLGLQRVTYRNMIFIF